jgi:hypothetical protein
LSFAFFCSNSIARRATLTISLVQKVGQPIRDVLADWGITRWTDLRTGRSISDQGYVLPIDLSQASSILIESSG